MQPPFIGSFHAAPLALLPEARNRAGVTSIRTTCSLGKQETKVGSMTPPPSFKN